MSVAWKKTAAGLALLGVLLGGTGAALAQNLDEPGLRGEFRTNMVNAGVSACLKLKEDKRAALIPPKLIDQSCTCVANKIADRLSMNDATKLMTLLMSGSSALKDPQMQDFQVMMLNSVGQCLVELQPQ